MIRCTICNSVITEQNEKRKNTVCKGCKVTKKVLENGEASRSSRIPLAAAHLDLIPEKVVHQLLTESKL